MMKASETIHDPRACLHHAVPMPEQLPQIAILCFRYPDSRKAIFHQQPQQLRVLAIRFLLPDPLRAHRGCVADPQLTLQLFQQTLEPARMPTGFHAHTHSHAALAEFVLELLGLFLVSQPCLAEFLRVGVHVRNLLEDRVIITTYNDHVRLLSPEPFGWFALPKSTRAGEPTL